MEKGLYGAHGSAEDCPLSKAGEHLKQVSMGQNDLSKFTPVLDLEFGFRASETSLRLPIQTNQAYQKLMLKTRLLTC